MSTSSPGDIASCSSLPKATNRQQAGKFKRGNRGRPAGSRNRRSLVLEALFAGEAEEIARKAIGLAKEGDPTSIKLILDRIAPARKGARIELPDFPNIQTIADVPAAHAFLIAAVAAGCISPDESAAIAATLDRYCSAVETVEMEARLAALEARLASPS